MDYASTINDLVLSRQKGDILESSGGSIEVGLHFNDREAVPKILRSFEVPFMVSFPGLSESDILEMEQHIARPIPDPYKNFLSQANGGFFFQNAFCFFGFSPTILRRNPKVRTPFRSCEHIPQPFFSVSQQAP